MVLTNVPLISPLQNPPRPILNYKVEQMGGFGPPPNSTDARYRQDTLALLITVSNNIILQLAVVMNIRSEQHLFS